MAWRNRGAKFLDIVARRGANCSQSFEEFRKRIEAKKPYLPKELSEGLGIHLSSITELLRIYRNDAGHPSGAVFDRETMFVHLQLFRVMLRKIYDLKTYFDSTKFSP